MHVPNKEARARLLGCPSQLYGVDRLLFDEGKAKGAAVYDVRTGGGLSYRVIADTGLDIGELTYRGIPIPYISKNGRQSPHAYHPFKSDFVHTFPGGMLYTCGLLSTGTAGRDENHIWQPTHGRYHAIPAEQCAGRVTEKDVIEISGLVRETRFSGHALEMRRTLRSPIGSNRLELVDRLTNAAAEPAEYMLLYHMNFGYPFLSRDLALELPDGTQTIGSGPDGRCRFPEPSEGGPGEESLAFLRVAAPDGRAQIGLYNAALGFGVRIAWSADTLPIMLQWYCRRSGEYVLGIEPSNTLSRGRAEERRQGTIGHLAPLETKIMRLSLEFFDG